MPSNGLVFITKSTFSAQSSVSIDNCFSATYIHYLVRRNFSGSSADQAVRIRLRASGSDASAANYRAQVLYADGSSSVGVRSLPADGLSSFSNALGYTETTTAGFSECWISNPFDAVITTQWNDISYDIDGNIRLYSQVAAHDLTNSYDGFTAFPASGTITGSISVFGLVKS